MAQVVWAQPALAELDRIADFIALDNPNAAARLVQKVFQGLDQLARHPESGPRVIGLGGTRYRQLSVPPCRVIYRVERATVLVVYVLRSEQRIPMLAR